MNWAVFFYESTGTGLPKKTKKNNIFSGVILLVAIGECGGGGGILDPWMVWVFRVFGPGV